MKTISLGKWRRIQQTATEKGTFNILALDHRAAFYKILQKETANPIAQDEITKAKIDIVRYLSNFCSAVLLDPETAVGQCIASGFLPGQTGLLTALDTGSTGDPFDQNVKLIEGWSVEKANSVGASGVKLLVYYRPDSPEASECETLVKQIAHISSQYDMPFFLEPLSYPIKGSMEQLSSIEKSKIVIQTAERLSLLGADVLKLEFPVNISEQPDENIWSSVCKQINNVCKVPWVLLSGGVSYETFYRQVQIACDAGASGVMVGRAIWNKAATLNECIRRQFLETEGIEKMERLRTLIDSQAKSFTEIYTPPKLSKDWYKKTSSAAI